MTPGFYHVRLLFLLTIPLCLAQVSNALDLPAIIGDHMMIQAQTQAPIWGTAEPGQQVTVSIGDQEHEVVAGDDGAWRVTLSPLEAGEQLVMRITAGDVVRQIDDILVGEVWVGSGQSNMQWSVRRSADAEQEIPAAEFPEIRLFDVARVHAHEPAEDVKGRWVRCTPETVAEFSAVAYYFGRELHQKLDRPVGLIHASWGGSSAEAWMRRESLEARTEFKPIMDRHTQALAEYKKWLPGYEQQLANWKDEAAAAREAGRPAPSRPGPPRHLQVHRWPMGLHNGMIAPLSPYAIRGVIWYQGEENASRAYQYRELFPALIEDWRDFWQQPDMPFLFVQLANFRHRKLHPSESTWAELREAQLMALRLPQTAMAVTIDIGEADDIHPRNKQDVGLRLALAALHDVYSQDVVKSGPIFSHATFEGDRVRVHFDHVGEGLRTPRGKPPVGFAIAGADRRFVWAQAHIEGETVVLHSEQVPEPVAVRYAWADNPLCNLYNEAGLPASPFRSDDFPGVTRNRE